MISSGSMTSTGGCDGCRRRGLGPRRNRCRRETVQAAAAMAILVRTAAAGAAARSPPPCRHRASGWRAAARRPAPPDRFSPGGWSAPSSWSGSKRGCARPVLARAAAVRCRPPAPCSSVAGTRGDLSLYVVAGPVERPAGHCRRVADCLSGFRSGPVQRRSDTGRRVPTFAACEANEKKRQRHSC